MADVSGQDLPAREAMEFDVVVVGAGPAGLAAAAGSFKVFVNFVCKMVSRLFTVQ